jgi:hypoxanthine phosphoribosyltransferase
MNMHVELDFIQVSTYGNGTCSSGKLNIKKDLDHDIQGRDVILVEDVVDSGFTLNELKKYLLTKKPKSLEICALFDKPSRRTAALKLKYVGFSNVEDHFIIGYGMDYAGKFRNLPYVGILAPRVYQNQ